MVTFVCYQGSHPTWKTWKNLNFVIYFQGLKNYWNLLKSGKNREY